MLRDWDSVSKHLLPGEVLILPGMVTMTVTSRDIETKFQGFLKCSSVPWSGHFTLRVTAWTENRFPL